MSDFIKILTHGRKLQGAVKALSIDVLEGVSEKLLNIIEKRELQLLEDMEANKARDEKLAHIRTQLEEAGLDVEDLKSSVPPKKSGRTGQKRPIKYKMTDSQGSEHTWTGIGRMPKVYAAALESGQSLDQFFV
jgi:DNA-binding protein H-NS